MDEVQVNVEDRWRVGLFGDNMRIPDFFEESFWHKGFSFPKKTVGRVAPNAF